MNQLERNNKSRRAIPQSQREGKRLVRFVIGLVVLTLAAGAIALLEGISIDGVLRAFALVVCSAGVLYGLKQVL